MQDGHVGRPVDRTGVLAGQEGGAAQHEDVVGARARGLAVEAEDGQLIHAVGRRAGVQHADDVVALGVAAGLAAQGVDLVAVAAGLAVQAQGVHGVELGQRAGGDGRVLQEVHTQRVFVGTAVHAHLRADGDEARIALAGAACGAAEVAEDDGVAVDVAVDADHLLAGRGRGERARPGTTRVAAGGAEGTAFADGGVGHQPAAQRDRAAVAVARQRAVGVGVGVVPVAEDIDEGARDDFAVLVQVDVVARTQRDRAALRKHLAVQYGAVGVGVVARQGGVVLGEACRAGAQQQQVVALPGRLVHGQHDPALEGVGQQQAQVARGLGDDHVRRGLQRHVVCAASVAAGVDLEGVGRAADGGAGAVGVQVDAARDDIGRAVAACDAGVDDGAATRAQRSVALRVHGVHTQVARDLVDVDTPAAGGGDVEHTHHAAVIRDRVQVGVDLEEVVRLAHTAAGAAGGVTAGGGHRTRQVGGVVVHQARARHQGDVATGHVGFGVAGQQATRVQDACR